MGLKITGGLLICGACGKRRGLGTHLCSPGRRKPRRDRLAAPKVEWTCSRCGKPRGLRHTCHIKTDFKKRKKAAARKAAAAARSRKRKAVRDRQAARRRHAAAGRRARARARKAAASNRAPRPRPPAHDYHTCGDGDCQKYGCVAYREGLDDGTAAGYAAAQADGGE